MLGRLANNVYLCKHLKKIDQQMNDDTTTEQFLVGDEELGCWMVAEAPPTRDLNSLLEDLHIAFGSGFVWTLKQIAMHGEFKPIPSETDIFSVGGETGDDYDNLLNAARKAVEHGYRVFILPNPQGIRTADFIFERKGVYKLFDLKTVIGKNSIDNRLMESMGQSNRVLLNLAVDYSPSSLARSIKRYFEYNKDALEVIIFKGKKTISITRDLTLSSDFYRVFMRRFVK